MVDTFLVPPRTVVDAKGDSAAVEVSGAANRVFLLNLEITNIVEQESLDLSIYSSADGVDPVCFQVVVQFGKEASQTRDYCVARNATHRAARPDPSLRKERLLRMTIKLHHYRCPPLLATRTHLLLQSKINYGLILQCDRS